MLQADSKTSSVTSTPSCMPVWSMISLPAVVFLSWTAGRQCMNFARGFSVLFIAARLT